MPFIRAVVLVAAAFAAAAGARAAEPVEVGFHFSPQSGQTVTWKATETESASFPGKQQEAVRWSEKLTLTFGQPVPDGFEAKLTVSAVTAEAGRPDTLHYTLAYSVQDHPIDVIVDTAGYIREVRNWPGVRAEMAAAISAAGDDESAKVLETLLDRLDAQRAGSAVARPLLLLSAAYGLRFRSDGSVAAYGDWEGGSAYIFPGRKVTTHLLGKQDLQLFAEWSIATDPKVAADRIGSEMLALFNAAANSSPGLAEAARNASAILATQGLQVAEEAGIAYDASVRWITKFQHRVRIDVGDFHKEQEISVQLVR